jgi:siroheme synthase-like protein
VLTEARDGIRDRVKPTLPVALKLEGRSCVIAGGGDEALFRAESLLAAGARVKVFALTPGDGLERAAEQGRLELARREIEETDLDGVFLLILTERDAELAARLEQAAAARQLLYCAVDQPAFGSFSHLAIARAGLLFAAIGTQGDAPALARRLRELFEELFASAGLATFVERLARLRAVTPSSDRKRVLGEAVAPVRLEGRLVLPDLPESDARVE